MLHITCHCCVLSVTCPVSNVMWWRLMPSHVEVFDVTSSSALSVLSCHLVERSQPNIFEWISPTLGVRQVSTVIQHTVMQSIKIHAVFSPRAAATHRPADHVKVVHDHKSVIWHMSFPPRDDWATFSSKWCGEMVSAPCPIAAACLGLSIRCRSAFVTVRWCHFPRVPM